METGFDADGFWTHEIALNPGRLGWFLVTAELVGGGKSIASDSSTLVIVRAAGGDRRGLEAVSVAAATPRRIVFSFPR